MKVIFPLSALTFFLLLAYLTHPSKRDGKSFFVFHLYSCFPFHYALKFLPYTLIKCVSLIMDTCVSKQIMAECKGEIYGRFLRTKSLVLHRCMEKLTDKSCFTFRKHKQLWLSWKSSHRTLRASIVQFSLFEARA